MEAEFLQLTKRMDIRPGAKIEAIVQVEQQLQKNLPADYIRFLMFTNGAEGSIGEGKYLELCSLEELLPINTANRVGEYAPGLLIFGSDGGGEAYGFNTNLEPYEIVQIPFIGLEWEDAIFISCSFIEFLQTY